MNWEDPLNQVTGRLREDFCGVPQPLCLAQNCFFLSGRGSDTGAQLQPPQLLPAVGWRRFVTVSSSWPLSHKEPLVCPILPTAPCGPSSLRLTSQDPEKPCG